MWLYLILLLRQTTVKSYEKYIYIFAGMLYAYDIFNRERSAEDLKKI